MAGNGQSDGRDAGDTARYIQHLAKELRLMASEVKLDFLAYLLAMVEDDAAATARQLNGDRPTGAERQT
jgi:hypothetical protein